MKAVEASRGSSFGHAKFEIPGGSPSGNVGICEARILRGRWAGNIHWEIRIGFESIGLDEITEGVNAEIEKGLRTEP